MQMESKQSFIKKTLAYFGILCLVEVSWELKLFVTLISKKTSNKMYYSWASSMKLDYPQLRTWDNAKDLSKYL